MTLAFAAAMAVVLGIAGTFVYLQFGSELEATIDSGLRSRATDVAALVRAAGSHLRNAGRGALVGRAESFAEVLDPGGRVLDSTRSVGAHVLLTPSELRRAQRGPVFLDRGPLPGLQDESRLLAAPAGSQGRRLVVVVGTSTEATSESRADLLQLLLVAGPAALLLSSLAAFGVATALLRPVRESIAHERRFVADASHELRTPLAILKAELDLALSRERSPAELREAIASGAVETDRLIQLTEDLLTIAQSDRGEPALASGPVDVERLVDGVARRFAGRAEETGVAIEADVEPGLAIEADSARLEQALGNLLDNALRHGSGPVRLVARRRGSVVELRVRDCGAGFAPDFLERAFDRFSRADPSRRDGGSGLGLAIVASVARAHGGQARVANLPGGGADAWIELPGRVPSEAGDQPSQPLPGSRAGSR